MLCGHNKGTRMPTDANASLDKANRDCLAKAKPGEPMFIILGRDPDGGTIVRLWAERRLAAGGDPEHANPVFVIADRMDDWRAAGNRSESAPEPSAYKALPNVERHDAQQLDWPRQGTADLLSALDEAVRMLRAEAQSYNDVRNAKGRTMDKKVRGSLRATLNERALILERHAASLRTPIRDEEVERAKVAALMTLARHGQTTDIQEALTHGNGRGTMPPGALDAMIRAAISALGDQS